MLTLLDRSFYPGFPKNGLASLLSYFCDFDADKRYQLADWRIRLVSARQLIKYCCLFLTFTYHRPLPEEMMYYARSDTHYLLYIYDNLRNLLLAHSTDWVDEVLINSSRTALQVFQREMYDIEEGRGPNGWRTFLAKFGNNYGNTESEKEKERRKAIVVAMHVWRDRIAREMDESPAYILPSKLIFRVANAPIIPKDLPSFLKIAPLTVLRDRASDLFDVIVNAKLPASLQAQAQASSFVLPSLTAATPAVSNAVTSLPGTSVRAEMILPDLWTTSHTSGKSFV